MNPTTDQLQVINHRSGPGLVLAGAGSGKTSTISLRTIELLKEGVPPSRILKMTFSRKAAGEMRTKMVRLAGAQLLKGLVVDTFHAYCFRLIREFPQRFGRTTAVTVADDSDQRRLIKESAKECGLDLKESKVKRAVEKARSIYSLAKNDGLTLARQREDVAELLRFRIGGLEKLHDQLMKMLESYETRLRKSNLLDFDDLCLLVGRELDQNREFAELIGRRYDHIVVDEAQDTNRTQFWIVRSLARYAQSQLLIGDQKQAIYGFRGARVENINNYIAEFEPRRYVMRENFRSTAAIVEGANAMIAHNRDLGESTSSATGGLGYTVLAAPDSFQGIRQIQDQFRRVVRSGVPLEEIAFLGRVKRLSRLAEVALSQIGIPSKIIGGMSLYDSLEGRAAIGAARLIQNPHDGPALAAMAAFHPLITEGLISAVLEGVANGLDVFTALRNAGRKGSEVALDLEGRLDRLRTCGPSQIGQWMGEPWGLDLPGYYQLKTSRARSSSAEELEKELNRRLENLALIDTATDGAIARVASERAGRELDPGEYGAWVTEAEQWTMVVESRLDDREEHKNARDAVTVMTVHRSKGLEWTYVFVLGASESILPLTGPDDDDEDDGANDGIEEERRLAYVAVTRAKTGCCLVHIENMGRFVSRNSLLEPSRFISEMGLEIPVPGLDQSELLREGVYTRKPVASGAPW